jgi:hypothetical protein
MRLLVDANLSPKVAAGLREAGFEAMHVADLDLLTATDDQIFDRAVDDGFVWSQQTATSGCCWHSADRRPRRSYTFATSPSSLPTLTSTSSSPTFLRSQAISIEGSSHR